MSKTLKELLFDDNSSIIPQYTQGSGIVIDENGSVSVDPSVLGDIEQLKTKMGDMEDCCSHVQAEITDIKLALQKIETDYYTKDEVDEIINSLLGGNPVIMGLTDALVDVGGTFDPMAGVTAEDSNGNDITSSIVVTGTVDTSTEGEYTLTYSVISGGKTTTETRKVIVEANVYHTTLFKDGTLIINEKERDRDANVALHGMVTNEYAPGPYEFTTNTSQPWNSKKTSILKVEFGSNYAPTSCQSLFYGLSNCTSIDFSKLNTSNVTSMTRMFCGCRSLTSLDLSSFDTSNVTTMRMMFQNCRSLISLDLSSFDTSNVTDMRQMFADDSVVNYSLTTIYAGNTFVVTQVTDSTNMFQCCNALVGGAGTTFDSTKVDKTYARIDNPPTTPGYFTLKP